MATNSPASNRLYGADGHVLERGVFTVPIDTTEERVQAVADRYMQRFGDALEQKGFVVKHMTRPTLDHRPVPPVEPDRKRYTMLAHCTRRPRPFKFTIPNDDKTLTALAGMLGERVRIT